MPDNTPETDFPNTPNEPQESQAAGQQIPKFLDADLPDPGPSLLQSRKPVRSTQTKGGLRGRNSEKSKSEKLGSGYIGVVSDTSNAVESLSGKHAKRKTEEVSPRKRQPRDKDGHKEPRDSDERRQPREARENRKPRSNNESRQSRDPKEDRQPRQGQNRQRTENRNNRNRSGDKKEFSQSEKGHPSKSTRRHKPGERNKRPQHHNKNNRGKTNPNPIIPKRSESERRATAEILSGKSKGLRGLLKKLIAPLKGKSAKNKEEPSFSRPSEFKPRKRQGGGNAKRRYNPNQKSSNKRPNHPRKQQQKPSVQKGKHHR